ncbi:MAG: DUF1616 domain-containing protein [Chloroflexi bacterium]|nr:DUF1616 domain-containing protein [Chloroflexota bacterium]
MTKSNKAVFYILILVIIGLIAAIVFLSVTPQPMDKFTEFYLLNQDGKASGYPAEIVAGQPASLITGIINHEGAPVTYRIQIQANGAIINSIETGTVLNDQKWEHQVDFSINSTGDNQTVKFYLYMNKEALPHIKDPLTLVTNVISPK